MALIIKADREIKRKSVCLSKGESERERER
jgi:hypothetical protein